MATKVSFRDAMATVIRGTAKYSNYADLYDLVFATLPKDPTIMEIGVANGGSLQTWRNLAGNDARIIGIDLDPDIATMQSEGFEILVMDTGVDSTWTVLHQEFAGGLDLLVDDGGHTNRQQLQTLIHGPALVRDGGWVVIEDLHASFMHHFGNPSPFSPARFLNQLTSDLHRLSKQSSVKPKRPNLAASVQYVVTGPSWVGLRIDRAQAHIADEVLSAGSDFQFMDKEEHRWDSWYAAKLEGKLPGQLLHNRATHALEWIADFFLYRKDSSRP
jgi:hypothetical protein